MNAITTAAYSSCCSGSCARVLAVALLVLYLVRAALIVFFVCAAPVCLLAHGLPQTEGTRATVVARDARRARRAGRAGDVLAGAVHVFFASGGHSVLGTRHGGGLVDLLLVLCLFYVLLRIPFWAKELVRSRRYASHYGPDGKDLCRIQGHPGRARGCAVSERRIRLPADVEMEDRLAWGLTARQLVILVVTALVCYACLQRRAR